MFLKPLLRRSLIPAWRYAPIEFLSILSRKFPMTGRSNVDSQQLSVPSSHLWRLALVLGLLLASAAGCGSPNVVNVQEDKSAQNLQLISSAYSMAANKLKRPPQGAQDITEILKNELGKPDPENILRSPDDNEPYVIVWGVNFGEVAKARGGNVDVILAYEAKGKGGKRHVLVPPGQVSLMTDEQFRAAAFPPGHTPAP
jgi:hypothetical protein